MWVCAIQVKFDWLSPCSFFYSVVETEERAYAVAYRCLEHVLDLKSFIALLFLFGWAKHLKFRTMDLFREEPVGIGTIGTSSPATSLTIILVWKRFVTCLPGNQENGGEVCDGFVRHWALSNTNEKQNAIYGSRLAGHWMQLVNAVLSILSPVQMTSHELSITALLIALPGKHWTQTLRVTITSCALCGSYVAGCVLDRNNNYQNIGISMRLPSNLWSLQKVIVPGHQTPTSRNPLIKPQILVFTQEWYGSSHQTLSNKMSMYPKIRACVTKLFDINL